jgi:hypothetical protein
VTGKRGAAALGEEVESILQPLGDLPGREQRDARGGELDRQRQPIKPGTEPRDRLLGPLGWHEVRLPLSRPLHEQAIGVLRSQRLKPPHRLTAYAQRLTTGGEDPERSARTQEIGGQFGTGINHVLAVIQHEQQIAMSQVRPKPIRCASAPASAQAQHPRDLRGDVGRRGRRGEVDQPHPVGTARDVTVGERQRQTRLPDTTRACQCHQPSPAQRLGEPTQFTLSTHQRGQGNRKVVRR